LYTAASAQQELPSNTAKQRFYGELLYMEESTMSGQLLVTVDSLAQPVGLGDRLVVYTMIRDISPAMNPGAFDYAKYLSSKDVFGQVYVDHNALLSRHKQIEALDWSQQAALYLANKVDLAPIHQSSKALLKALLLGQKQDVTARFKERFRAAGVMHVLALSGLHVGILLLLLQGVTQPIRRLPYGAYLQVVLVVSGLWTFAFVAGLSPSICRAVTMFSFFSLGWLSKRRSGKYTALFASGFVLLIWDPRLLFDVGFQLSYAAVFAILSWQPLLASLWSTRWWVLRKVRDILSVSIAAQLGVVSANGVLFSRISWTLFVG
jgi:ComEC/Rec2-related protein